MGLAAPPKRLEELSEKEWDALLFGSKNGAATLLGWRLCYHTLRSKGSRAGFPDRVLVRERIVYAELKSEAGKPTPEQREWLDGLARAGGECYLLRPTDLDEVTFALSKRWTFQPGTQPGLRRVEESTETFWTPKCMWVPGRGRFDA